MKARKSQLRVVFQKETDGRWIAEVPSLPGVLAYGATKSVAQKKVYAVALRTLAQKIDDGRVPSPVTQIFTHAVAER